MLSFNLINVDLYYSTGARPLSNAYYGQGYGTILLDDVRCTGNETDIDDCIHSPWDYNNCGHNEDVGVQCRPTGMNSAYLQFKKL